MFIIGDQEVAQANDILASRITTAINALPEKNAKTMAEATRDVLHKYCDDTGMSRSEVGYWEPGQQAFDGDGNRYLVSLEAGPYQWAIGASMAIVGLCGKLAEPYYSFDLSFYPGED